MPRVTIKRVILFIYAICFTLIFILFFKCWLTEQEQSSFFFNVDWPMSDTQTSDSSTGYSYKWTSDKKPWFMRNGSLRPDPQLTEFTSLKIWPEEVDFKHDRLVNQLMYIPLGYDEVLQRNKSKKILLFGGQTYWNLMDLAPGREVFLRDKCPVNTCYLTPNKKDYHTADAVIFRNTLHAPQKKPFEGQTWIFYFLESPFNAKNLPILRNVINIVATYKHGSDIVTPYEKFVSYPESNLNENHSENYALGKTKKVAWFVSNCKAKNKRLEYAKALSEFIEVDIYGRCGQKKCSRRAAKGCFDMIDRDYKFYLSFENSNCREYITEKFFVNGLMRKVVPIVMGAPLEDYERVAPPGSFIHVDNFSSPEELAKYLHKLDTNDTLYNEYFMWKNTGEFINTYFWCRLCAILHSPKPSKTYSDVAHWLKPPGTCVPNLASEISFNLPLICALITIMRTVIYFLSLC